MKIRKSQIGIICTVFYICIVGSSFGQTWSTHEPTGLGSIIGASQMIRKNSGVSGTANVFMSNLWLYRDAAGSDWFTTRLHDGISVDASYLIPGSNTRTWWERDPFDNIQSWGDLNNTYLTIKNGLVGIGTTSPQSKLQVLNGKLLVGYDNGQMTRANIDNIYSDFGTIGIADNFAGDLHLRGFWGVVIDKNGGNYGESSSYSNGVNPAGGSFAVRTRISETAFRTDMIIRNNGNVGIGTTTPQAKLAVNGTILATEIKVKTDITVPDYVFDDEYILPTLSETEAYIKANKHLPEIPSAVEVKANGLDLAEMNLLLLKKVEELTLHLIEQEKRLVALEKENESLK